MYVVDGSGCKLCDLCRVGYDFDQLAVLGTLEGQAARRSRAASDGARVASLLPGTSPLVLTGRYPLRSLPTQAAMTVHPSIRAARTGRWGKMVEVLLRSRAIA
jgi:hypothetical protein